MSSDLIPVTFDRIMQSPAYTVLVLGNEAKKFAIYTEPHVGQHIQLNLMEEHKFRPYTHDLIKAILDGLEVKILQIVINNAEDTIYFARIFLEQLVHDERHILEIDARPSDCITLSLMYNAPLFCRKDLFDTVIALED